jgi:hypothetical protein
LVSERSVDLLYSDAAIVVSYDEADGWIGWRVDGRGYAFRGGSLASEEARELAAALVEAADLADEKIREFREWEASLPPKPTADDEWGKFSNAEAASRS